MMKLLKLFLNFNWVLELNWSDDITWAVKFDVKGSEYWRDEISNNLDIFWAKLTSLILQRFEPLCLTKHFNCFERSFNRPCLSLRSRLCVIVRLTELTLCLFCWSSLFKAHQVNHSFESESQYAVFIFCCDWQCLLAFFQSECSVAVVKWFCSITPHCHFWLNSCWSSDTTAVIKHDALQSVKHKMISLIDRQEKWASSIMLCEKALSHASYWIQMINHHSLLKWGVILNTSSSWLSTWLKDTKNLLCCWFDLNQWAQNDEICWVRCYLNLWFFLLQLHMLQGWMQLSYTQDNIKTVKNERAFWEPA